MSSGIRLPIPDSGQGPAPRRKAWYVLPGDETNYDGTVGGEVSAGNQFEAGSKDVVRRGVASISTGTPNTPANSDRGIAVIVKAGL